MYRPQPVHILIGLIGFTAFILMLWTLPSHGNYLTPRNLLMWMVIFLICGVGFVPVALSGFIKIKRVWLVGLIPPTYILLRMMIFGSDMPEATLLTITALTGFWLLLIALLQINITEKQWDLIFDILLVGTFISLLVTFIFPVYFKTHLTFLPDNMKAPFAGFEQRNVMASFLASLVTLSFVRDVKLTRPRKLFSAILQSFFTIMFVTVIFGNGSQAGMLGLMLACFMVSIMALFFVHDGNRPVRQVCVFWCLILAGYFLNLLLPSVHILTETKEAVDLFNDGLAAQFSSNLSEIQGSQTLRIKGWLITLSLIGDAPIFGHGLGRFSDVFYETLTSSSEFHKKPYFFSSLSHPHNEILYILSEHGLIGFLLITVPFIYMASGMMKQAGPTSLYILALLLPIGLHSMVEFPLYISGLHWLLLSLMIVWALNFEKASLTSQPFLPAIRPSIRLFLILGVISLPSFYAGQMAFTLHQAWVHTNDYRYKNFAGYIEHSKYRPELWHPLLGRRYTTLHEMVVVSEASNFGYKEIVEKLLPKLESERHHFETYGYWVALAKGYELLDDTEKLESHLNRIKIINPHYHGKLINSLNLEVSQ